MDPSAPRRDALPSGSPVGLASTLGMRPLQAQCHHELGILYSRLDRVDRACSALSTAIGLSHGL